MARRLVWLGGLSLALSLAIAATSEAGWNPFQRTASTTTREVAPDPFDEAESESDHRQLLDGKPLVHDDHHGSDDDADSPGLLSRMGQGTSNFFAGAKSALRLRRRSPDEPQTASEYSPWAHTGSGRSKPREEKRGWFSGWFSSSDDEAPAETVQDWIAQDRPGM